MIEKLNKTRLRNGLLAVLLAITLIVPAVFQSTTLAASKQTPARPAITKVTATKNFATVTWNFQLFISPLLSSPPLPFPHIFPNTLCNSENPRSSYLLNLGCAASL